MLAMLDTVIEKSQVYMTRISGWQNKVDFRLTMGPYVLKIAQSKSEVIDCFRLRHEVFCKEMAGRSTKSRLDYDEYDLVCDHLIIQHEPTGKIVGTYRLNFSETSDKFYTNSEFQLTEWLEQQENSFIELGRACIHSEHRRGAVISLLWRGIAEYMKTLNAEMLFGCSSVKVTDARSAALIYKYFELKGYLHVEQFPPREKYQMKDFFFWMMVFARGLTEQQIAEADDKIPSLLKAYIKAGAKVASYPALDMDFNCIDFMTLLQRKDLDEKLVRKYNT